MCLFKRYIKTTAKLLPLDNSTSAILQVNCGRCSECIEQKSAEYIFRSYYQAASCIQQGGYVLFDTLTFKDECLPHLSDFSSLLVDKCCDFDFPCFNREYVRNFFKRLRIQLSRSGFDVKNHLKYFLTSEYGTDERYTHRPHHHILFYVSNPELSPLTLSAAISHAWTYGLTDGLPYQPLSYVYNHVYGRMSTSSFDDVITRKVCNYVAKYVCKDSDFFKIVLSRIDILSKYCNFHLDLSNSEFSDNSEYIKFVKRCVSPFHLQSIGFGADFLAFNNLEDVLMTGDIVMPDAKLGKKTLHLPQYFARKLFYDLYYIDGKPKWVLNAQGIAHNRCYVRENISKLAQKFKDWHNSLQEYFGSDNAPDVDLYIRNLLCGRSYEDFASYIMLYRGRVMSRDFHDDFAVTHRKLSFDVDSQIDNIYKSFQSTDVVVNGYDSFYPHNTLYRLFDLVSPDLYGSKHFIYNALYNRDEYFFKPRNLNYSWVLHDFHVRNCEHFDDLFNLYCYSLKDFNVRKDLSYFIKKKKAREINNLSKLLSQHGLSIPSQTFSNVC